MNKIIKNAVFFLILLSTFYFLLSTSLAAAPSELKESIDQKARELQEISGKIKENQKNLEETQGQGKTLEREVGKIDSNIKQVDLGIRSSEIVIGKLGLEINSIKYDIDDAEKSIISKREAIAKIIQELQQKDNESFLIIFLKNKSLAEGVFETQNLTDLNNNLSTEISNLTNAKIVLADKLEETDNKKNITKIEQENLKNKKIIADEIKKEKQSLLEQTKNQEKNYQKQLSELEKQQMEISDEISGLEDELRRTFDPSLLPSKRPGVFAWPIKLVKDGGIGRITEHFGGITLNIRKGKPHNGLDIGVPIGTPVYAAEDGTVEAVDNNDKSYYRKYQYGKYVFIKHNNNMSTLYAHLSKYIVSRGSSVKRGEIIGYSGNTGYSTGPHLHLGVYWSNSMQMKSVPLANGLVPIGVIINPEDYL